MFKKFLGAALALAMAAPAFAATPGVNDFVTCVRGGAGHGAAIQFQTANGGGNVVTAGGVTVGTGICNPQATWFCVGTGTGANSVNPTVSAIMMSAIIGSRNTGSGTGPFIQFTDNGTGFYGDCSAQHGVSPVDQ